MLDGGLVVGYLAAALLGAAGRLRDRTVDSALDRLFDLVATRMGHGPLDRLSSDPADPALRREMTAMLDGAIMVDPGFAQDLARVVDELDRNGGRALFNLVQAHSNVQVLGDGVAVGRDWNYMHVPDPTDMSGSPVWVKACFVLGLLVAAIGFGLFLTTFFTAMEAPPRRRPAGPPDGLSRAFGLFAVGVLIIGIGALGRAMSRRR